MTNLKTMLIVNPESGQGHAARAKRKLLQFADDSPHIDVLLTSGPEDAQAFASHAEANGYDRIIAAGGDGTVNQVINGMGDSKMPLGIVPLGTANVLAHELNIPIHAVSDALLVIMKGKTRNVDVGIVGDKRFLLMAGFGIDAEVVDTVSSKAKDIFGTMAYFSTSLQQIFKYEPVHLKLSFDNNVDYETEAYGVIVANCGSYAYNFKIAPEAVFDDGLLDIIVFEHGPAAKYGFLTDAVGSMIMQKLNSSNATYFKASRVNIDTKPLVKMQIDGEPNPDREKTDIRVLHKALTLIVP